jgi:hypothetical protein
MVGTANTVVEFQTNGSRSNDQVAELLLLGTSSCLDDGAKQWQQ